MIKNVSNIKFLNVKENECLSHLNAALEIFAELCSQDPQHPSDTYNFGHYVDAARHAVIMRGARRLDPENLLPKSKTEG